MPASLAASHARLGLAVVCGVVLSDGLRAQARAQVRMRKVASPGTAVARSFGGVYPHLASFNRQSECGTGAVVPFADRLWWLTYAPHRPDGSDDKLYAMNDERELFVGAGSIGGTPANRMIHRESRQLFLGPYAIDADGKVRVIPYSTMRGRPTGNARHLFDPEHKIYYATMEEGLYEVDVATLAVAELFADTHHKRRADEANLPGYHGKGLFSGQGVLVYANNGEYGAMAKQRPDVPSGVLAEWDGKKAWRVVRRNQFTDVTGPGGIHGNANPATDPLWSIGWDHRSLVLMLRSAKAKPGDPWRSFRLPKATHTYDGAHGWNTEWPRIRDIGERDLLMTMHGTLWRFPRTFDLGTTAGIAPRSTFLKVVADFCRFGDEVVFGCDDAAKNEFLNTRRAKGRLAGPAESQSNLWFVRPSRLDRLGPALGRGGVFVRDAVAAGAWSEPYLFAGYSRRAAHLVHDAKAAVRFSFEVDRGDGKWRQLRSQVVGPGGYAFVPFGAEDVGSWVRVATDRSCRATVWFEFRNDDERTDQSAAIFDGFSKPGAAAHGGLLRAGDRELGLQVLATAVRDGKSTPTGYYELGTDLSLRKVAGTDGERTAAWMQKRVAVPRGVVERNGNSMLYVDDRGRRWRLPIGNPSYRERDVSDLARTAREVVTERDLFQCGGTFYELPARNAGGFVKVRPIATHPYLVQEFCSWRGLLVLTGLRPDVEAGTNVVRSEDGGCALWLGVVDDLWRLGKPRGDGGPWHATRVSPNVPSDPFLMTGFDRKAVSMSHDRDQPVTIDIEVDISGTGEWCRYRSFEVSAGKTTSHEFPPMFAAYWARAVARSACRATVTFRYR